MTDSVPERVVPVQQNNTGSGILVGGHVFGNVEMVDAKTKAVLAQISRDTPRLGAAITQLLRQGAISPDTVLVLAGLSRHINEDVAMMLSQAGRNINEDVAMMLSQAGRNINEEVAERFQTVAGDLAETVERFHEVSVQMTKVSATLTSARSSASGWHDAAEAVDEAAINMAHAAQLYAQSSDRFSWNSFWKGVGAGLIGALILAGLVLALVTHAR
jgi:hypothetical protein